jgi:hypothetical protein
MPPKTRTTHESEVPEAFREAFRRDHQDALGYHGNALTLRDEGACASVVFNVASIALERYLLALCALHGVEPRECTLGSLAREAADGANSRRARGGGFPESLVRAVQELESAFDICSLENRGDTEPGRPDAERSLALCDLVAGFCPGPGLGHGSGRGGGCGGPDSRSGGCGVALC